jgi:hypothetical protein
MIYVNEFDAVRGNVTAAYAWPESPLPQGRIVGQQGNALLMEIEGGVAVISAPRTDVYFGVLHAEVDLSWAF